MVEFDPILVHEWLRRSARRCPEKTALIVGDEKWTYAALDFQTDVLSQTLRSMGVKHQDRVLILLDNSSESVISMYAILKAGAVFVFLSPSIKGKKLRYIHENSGSRLLITHTHKARVVKKAFGQSNRVPTVIWAGAPAQIPKEMAAVSAAWGELACNNYEPDAKVAKRNPGTRVLDIDIAALIYTSGTTGVPKGVVCTHLNMVSVARSVIQYIGNQPDDRILNALPLSFGYGLYQVIMAFMFGGAVILERSFMFPAQILSRIGQEKATGFPIVPTVAAMLLRMKDLAQFNMESLRYLTSAGAALPVKHILGLQKLLTQVTIFSMYGLTECKRVSFLSPRELDRKPDSVGRPIPNCAVSLVDENGREVAANQLGELIVRGANVMQGYWGDVELTSEIFREGVYPHERWLHTGDYFRRDNDGFLYFVGRRDDMINCRGERVSAQEIENCICCLEEVAEAAVVGVPDDVFGQAIKAFVACHPEHPLLEKDLLRYCSRQMESHMVPKYLEFMAELPKTSNGKIDKQLLKQMASNTV